jgi:flagellar hook-length control protein FliK
MLTIHPTSLRTGTSPAEPTLTTPGSDPAGFASLLRQSRSVAPPMPAAPPAPAPQAGAPASEAPPAQAPATAREAESADNDAGSTAAPPESDSTGRARALQRAKLRAAEGRGDANRATPSASAHAAPGSARAEANATAEAPAPATAPESAPAAPLDPAVMHWLADQQRAPGALPAPAQGGAAATADATLKDAPPEAAADGLARARPASGAAVERDTDPAASRARSNDLPAAAPFAAVLAEQRATEKPLPADRGGVRGVDGAGASGAAALAATPDTIPTAATAVAIAAPVQTPDFAQELGLRLSVLARDGVHEAELHLNPADMGPVSVQIVMDGTQARIDFGADVAATRQAIEAGLPELASALRDAGFTLAGGGVSQHAGGRRDGREDPERGTPDTRRAVAAPELQRVATAARRLVRAGGVDTFA